MTESPRLNVWDPETVDLCRGGRRLIEASAGTGKTYTITNVVLRLLLEPAVGRSEPLKIEEILVVTYTKAAAAELRERIRRRVQAALAIFQASAPVAPDLADEDLRACWERFKDEAKARERLARALANIDLATIATIHAFCQAALSEQAFETGAVFGAELTESNDDLVTDIVYDFWQAHIASQPVAKYLSDTVPKLTIARLRQLADRLLKSDPAQLPTLVPTLAPAQADADAGGDRDVRKFLVEVQHRFAVWFLGEYERRHRLANSMSFDDLLRDLSVATKQNPNLPRHLRQRFPVALIDEFQDTDPIQFGIFDRLYPTQVADGLMLVVGDPKQSIYRFRGADIFSYLSVRQSVSEGDRLPALLTNRRSDARLVEVVNRLFTPPGGTAPFAIEDPERPEIAFAAAVPERRAPKPDPRLRLTSGGDKAPFCLTYMSAESSGEIDVSIAGDVARKIARLLQERVELWRKQTETWTPLVPKDIVVLVRAKSQAELVQRALSERGVPAALTTDSSVFASPEAYDLYRVLLAIANPNDRQAVLSALGTAIFRLDAGRLAALFRASELETAPDERWATWVARFGELQRTWQRSGFSPMFTQLLASTDNDANLLLPRLLLGSGGLRAFTNFRQLGELISARAAQHHWGLEATLAWFGAMIADPNDDSRRSSESSELRLETDADCVRIMTMHVSKGLQFPVVFCPYLWKSPQRFGSELMYAHAATASERRLEIAVLDGHGADADIKARNQREIEADAMRLTYVALTRAENYCHVHWALYKKNHDYRNARAPLTVLLSAGAAAGKQDDTAKERKVNPDAWASRMLANWQAVIEIAKPEDSESSATAEATKTQPATTPLHALPPAQIVPDDWRRHSFSALGFRYDARKYDPAGGTDEGRSANDDRGPADVSEIPLDAFDTGAAAGNCLHEIFERLDFTKAIDSQKEVLKAALEKFGLKEKRRPKHVAPQDALNRDRAAVLTASLARIVETPLRLPAGGSSCLRHIGSGSRLNELAFFLPMSRKLDTQALAAALQIGATSGNDEHLLDYAAGLAKSPVEPLQGAFTGVIDLLFRHSDAKGQYWYVLDYKSNRLGATPERYAPSALQRVMAANHYILQYHVYAVAARRFLKTRLATENAIAGAIYLFLRGVGASASDPSCGVYVDAVPTDRLDALDELFAWQASRS